MIAICGDTNTLCSAFREGGSDVLVGPILLFLGRSGLRLDLRCALMLSYFYNYLATEKRCGCRGGGGGLDKSLTICFPWLYM